MTRRTLHRRAFTLVELLVVLAIIGVLVALLIPAVQFARERARQATCSSNMRQIGLAFTQHAVQFEKFPNGGGYDINDDNNLPWDLPPKELFTTPPPPPPRRPGLAGWGWAFQILPYLELNHLKQPAYADTAGASAAAAGLVPSYFCPSRRPPEALDGVGCGLPNGPRGAIDYAGNGGYDLLPVNYFPSPLSWRQLSSEPDHWRAGALVASPDRNVPGPGNLPDGASNTLLAGERRLTQSSALPPDEDNGYVAGWTWDTVRWAYQVPLEDDLISTAPDIQTRFGSSHGAGTYFVMCDGSVKMISYNVDLAIFRGLSGREDKSAPDPDSY
ncbi:MAG: DUF1559 domain-containing protein [Pirellulaceae bacterium]